VQVLLHADDDTQTVVREAFTLRRETLAPDTPESAAAGGQDLLAAVQGRTGRGSGRYRVFRPGRLRGPRGIPRRHRDSRRIVMRTLFGTLRSDSHHPSRKDATVPDSPPPDLTYEAGSAFVRAAGLVVDTVTATEVAGHLDVGVDHHTAWGVVHGGVYSAAIESAAGVGASAAVGDRGQFAVGVCNVTNFLRPVRAGRLTVTASAVQQGRTLQLWSVRVVREDGRAVADGQVRLQNVPLPAAGSKDRSNE
jgi:1,4-dihydroxy-2-naphthoyl-CoA hydrolase